MFDLTRNRWPIPDQERVESLAEVIYTGRNNLDYNRLMALEDAYEILSANEAIDQGIEREISCYSRNGRFFIELAEKKVPQTDIGGDTHEEYTP